MTAVDRVRRIAPAAASVVAAAVLGLWAGATVLAMPSDPVDDSSAPEVFSVRDGEVGRSVAVMATAEWSRDPLTPATVGGVVTSIHAVGSDRTDEGEVLFTVDLRPVVALQGTVPMFRDLGVGESGADVEQLQAGLGRLGYFDGTPDGTFGPSTHRAVRAWQRSIGVTDDGVVRSGDVVFVDIVPARIALSEGIGVGSHLSPGQQVLWRVAAEPSFRLVLPMDQGGLIEPGMAVEVVHGGGTWSAEVAAVARGGDAREIEGRLVGITGGSVCGEECAGAVPLVGQSTHRSVVVLTPPTSGAVVPMAAIVTTADGRAQVMRSTGEAAEVTIVELADGLAVVEGIEVGARIFVPFPPTRPTGVVDR